MYRLKAVGLSIEELKGSGIPDEYLHSVWVNMGGVDYPCQYRAVYWRGGIEGPEIHVYGSRRSGEELLKTAEVIAVLINSRTDARAEVRGQIEEKGREAFDIIRVEGELTQARIAFLLGGQWREHFEHLRITSAFYLHVPEDVLERSYIRRKCRATEEDI